MANTYPGSGLVVLDCLRILNNNNSDNNGHISYYNDSTGVGSATNAQLLGISKYGCLQYMVWEDKGARIGMRSVTSGGIGDLHFTAGSDSVKMIIRCSGNIDIQSGGILNIYRADNTRALQLYTTNDETVIDSWAASSEPLMIRSNGSGGRIVLHTNGAERVRINCAGNVGIGTASPSSRLDVCGADGKIQSRVDSSDGSTINVRPNAGKCGWISYTEDAVADRWGIGVKNGDAKLYFASGNVGSAGGTTRMVIDGGGCVGINTTTPSYRLHVNGTFYAAGSSQEYKTSVCKYDTDSCMFMKLKPVTYQYKDEYKHLGKELKSETQIGLIAEEVAETYPELAILVNEENLQVVRNVDYEKLSIVLLSEVQKLRKEVDDLKTK